MSDGISLREFGRLVSKSGEAVRRAIQTGKIPASAVGETTLTSGRKRPTIVNVELAAKAWGKNTDPAFVRDPKKLSQGRKAAYARDRGEEPPAEPGDAETGNDDTTSLRAGGEIPSITESRAISEAYKARMARLEYLKMRDQLVDAAEFKIKFVSMVKAAQSKIMAVPGKAKSRIPTLTVRDIELLEDLLSEAMEELANGG